MSVPEDVRIRTSPQTPEEARLALEAWRRRDGEHQAERDALVLAARKCGINVRQIAIGMGISRTTVYSLLEKLDSEEAEKS